MDLYKFFKNSISITVIFEVFALFFFLIYLVFFMFFGGVNLFGTELNVFLVLITLGISCLITLLGIGVFMRVRDKLVKFIGLENNFPIDTLAEKIVLTIWAAAVCFFSAAVFYGFFLIYKNSIIPVYGAAFGILVIFIMLGSIIICALLQLFLIIMAKYTTKVIREVLAD